MKGLNCKIVVSLVSIEPCNLYFYLYNLQYAGGCSSVGRAGPLVIGRLLVQTLALSKAELHVEVFLSKTLNPTLLISKGPVMNWRLVQGVPCPRHETRLGLAPAATSRDPMERDKRLRIMTWQFTIYQRFWRHKGSFNIHCTAPGL